MFDETIRAARSLNGRQEINVTSGLVADEEGYIDRQCPHKVCEFTFKVLKEDWESDRIRDDEVFCPSCGHAADANQWFTPEQVEFRKRQILNHVAGKIGAALEKDARDWNRGQRSNRFFSVKLKVGGQWKSIELPPAVSDPMKLQIGCSECGCRYAVVGAAYFCPGCGHNSADLMFSQTLRGIISTLDALKLLPDAISDVDTRQILAQAVIERGLQAVVAAFQRYVESLYSRNAQAAEIRRNAFQNLEEGSRLWQGAFGKSYASHLTVPELGLLGQYFQQRHLLAHQQGIIDDAYVSKSGDDTYRVGQRLILKEDAVRSAVNLVEWLGARLAKDVG